MAFIRVARPVCVAAALLSATLAGCGPRDEIRSYTVPRASERSAPAGHGFAAPGGDYRILGAVYPADNPQWYFKLTGSAAALAKHEADFDKFIASVKLKLGALPDFTLPDGWTRGGPREVSRGGITVRFEQTIKFAGLELTVSRSQGGLVGNVDRWSGQVGGPNVTAANVGQFTREFQADGTKGVRVDVTGKSNPAGGPMSGGGR